MEWPVADTYINIAISLNETTSLGVTDNLRKIANQSMFFIKITLIMIL